jgi:general secretion pathway protein J
MTRKMTQGFTLIELMVALLIFGMLASAGVTLLGYATRAQEIAGTKDKETAQWRTLSVILTQDLAQAVPHPTRTNNIDAGQAFVGATADSLFSYVRGGGRIAVEEGQGPLNRVTWAIEDGLLVRRIYAGTESSGKFVAVPMIKEVETATVRFRSKGAWRSDWIESDPAALPSAIELVVDTKSGQPLTITALAGLGQ